MTVQTFDAMIGATISRVIGKAGDDRMVFQAIDGRSFHFYHSQDCCESVCIEDVCGDLDDLIDSPIVLAEEVYSDNEPVPAKGYTDDSYTWTFYRFGTPKGTVTVRWLGESNGYYSEGVDFHIEGAALSSSAAGGSDGK